MCLVFWPFNWTALPPKKCPTAAGCILQHSHNNRAISRFSPTLLKLLTTTSPSGSSVQRINKRPLATTSAAFYDTMTRQAKCDYCRKSKIKVRVRPQGGSCGATTNLTSATKGCRAAVGVFEGARNAPALYFPPWLTPRTSASWRSRVVSSRMKQRARGCTTARRPKLGRSSRRVGRGQTTIRFSRSRRGIRCRCEENLSPPHHPWPTGGSTV